MTLKTIANMAGVSCSTVSRIINSPNNNFATKEVRERVWNAIIETGYVPNKNAQLLKKSKNTNNHKQNRSLVCILGNIYNLDDNPYFFQLFRSIQQQALDQGYSISLVYSVYEINSTEIINKINNIKPIAAIILGETNSNHINLIKNYHKNLIYINNKIDTLNYNLDQIIYDAYNASKIAIEHLVSYGHRYIGYIGETSNEACYQAYMDMIYQHGFKFDKNIIVTSKRSSTNQYSDIEKLINKSTKLPTAIFCSTDKIAIRAIDELKQLKIKVPEDISIISIDNIEDASYTSPMLTTVGPPIEEVGSLSVQIIISRIQRKHHVPLKIFFPNRLINRDSVLNLNAGAYI